MFKLAHYVLSRSAKPGTREQRSQSTLSGHSKRSGHCAPLNLPPRGIGRANQSSNDEVLTQKREHNRPIFVVRLRTGKQATHVFGLQ